MFDELEKYKNKNHFFLNPEDNLRQVCNAPTDKSGVYIIYALKNGKVELIYIGCSGKIDADGNMFVRKAGLGGLKDRLVNGHQFGKIPRRKSWITQMQIEKIEALDVYWYATHEEKFIDCPTKIESQLLQTHQAIFGQLPRWNKEMRII